MSRSYNTAINFDEELYTDEDFLTFSHTERVDYRLNSSPLPSKTPEQPDKDLTTYGGVITTRTEQLPAHEDLTIFRVVKAKPKQPTPSEPEQKKSLDGCVIEVHSESVLCEIYNAENTVLISLPLLHFDFPITIGTPFSLSIDDTSGYRRPIVKPRQPNSKIAEQDIDDIDKLIKEI